MNTFKLTEHAIMRFKQRYKENINKDNFDLYSILKKEIKESTLDFVSSDGKTYYFELPNYKNLYFVVDKSENVCMTIKSLSANEKIRLELPSKFNQ